MSHSFSPEAPWVEGWATPLYSWGDGASGLSPGKRQDFESQFIWLNSQACGSFQQTPLPARIFQREPIIVANGLLVKDHKLGIQYKVTTLPSKKEKPGCLPLLVKKKKPHHAIVGCTINIHCHDISIAGSFFWRARMLLICILLCIHLHSLSICKIRCS